MSGRICHNAILAVDADSLEGAWSEIPVATVPAASQMTSAKERAPPVALNEPYDGPICTNSVDWGTNEPLSTRYGVITNEKGEVSDLLLPSNKLRGQIPDLSALTKLTMLDLAGNILCLPVGLDLSMSNADVAAHLADLTLPFCPNPFIPGASSKGIT